MKKNKASILNVILIFLFSFIIVFSIIKLYQTGKSISDVKNDQGELIMISGIEEDIDVTDSKFNIDFEELRKINKDIVGWILFENTSISYPIVQTTDNTYYLNHSFYKKYHKAGAIFMETSADSTFLNRNTFIYGHNGIAHTMFSDLKLYMKKDFQQKNPYGYLYTPKGNYKIEIFSAYTAPAVSNSYQLEFKDEENFLSYIDVIKNKGKYKTDIEVTTDDRIISFYTCSYENGNQKRDRYFVHGKLIPIE